MSNEVRVVTIPEGIAVSTPTVSPFDVEDGTWLPVENVGSRTNIAALTPATGQYLRVNDTVTCSVKIDIDPTSTGGWVTELTLPVDPDVTFVSNGECVGPGTRDASGTSEACYVRGSTTAKRFRISGIAADSASRSAYFNFTYKLR